MFDKLYDLFFYTIYGRKILKAYKAGDIKVISYYFQREEIGDIRLYDGSYIRFQTTDGKVFDVHAGNIVQPVAVDDDGSSHVLTFHSLQFSRLFNVARKDIQKNLSRQKALEEKEHRLRAKTFIDGLVD